jgi:hypothetical protein
MIDLRCVGAFLGGGEMGICETALLCFSLLGTASPESRNNKDVHSSGSFVRAVSGRTLAGAMPRVLFQNSTAAIADNASLVQFSIYGAKLYFRNLHAFNPEWAGCCYNYYIDLTTDDGKSMYAYFMLQYANRARIVLWRESVAPGPIQQMGNWS